MQVIAGEPYGHQSSCQIASATENGAVLKFEEPSNGQSGMLMMRGMTAKNFDPIRYSGRWYEVASFKRGFAGQGQEDCHCTQVRAGMYLVYCSSFSISIVRMRVGVIVVESPNHACLSSPYELNIIKVLNVG